MRRSKEVIGGKRVKDVGGDGWGCRGQGGCRSCRSARRSRLVQNVQALRGTHPLLLQDLERRRSVGVEVEGEDERGEATDSAGLCGWDGRWASHSPEPQRRRQEAPGPLPFGPRAS